MTDLPFEKPPDAPEPAELPRYGGTVSRWTVDRGFGFLTPGDSTEDVFAHFSAIVDGNALEEGARVEFVKVFDERRGKYRAEEVSPGITVERHADPHTGYFGSRRPFGRSYGICYDFLAGHCTRGASCRFAHETPNVPLPPYGGMNFGGFPGMVPPVGDFSGGGDYSRGPQGHPSAYAPHTPYGAAGFGGAYAAQGMPLGMYPQMPAASSYGAYGPAVLPAFGNMPLQGQHPAAPYSSSSPAGPPPIRNGEW